MGKKKRPRAAMEDEDMHKCIMVAFAAILSVTQVATAQSAVFGGLSFPIFSERVTPLATAKGELIAYTYVVVEVGGVPEKRVTQRFNLSREELTMEAGEGLLIVNPDAGQHPIKEGVAVHGGSSQIIGRLDHQLQMYDIPPEAVLSLLRTQFVAGIRSAEYSIPFTLNALLSMFRHDERWVVFFRSGGETDGHQLSIFVANVQVPHDYDLGSFNASDQSTWPLPDWSDYERGQFERSEKVRAGLPVGPSRPEDMRVARTQAELSPGRAVTIISDVMSGDQLASGHSALWPTVMVGLWLPERVGLDGVKRLPALPMGPYDQLERRLDANPRDGVSDHPLLKGRRRVWLRWTGDPRHAVITLDWNIVRQLPHQLNEAAQAEEYLVQVSHSHNSLNWFEVNQTNELWVTRDDMDGRVYKLEWRERSQAVDQSTSRSVEPPQDNTVIQVD